MKSILFLIGLGFTIAISAAPANFTVLKLPAAFTPVVDGFMSDWPSGYRLGSITGDENVFGRDATAPLNPSTEWNGDLYAAWDDQWVYFAVKVTVDDDVKAGVGYEYDGFKINPGGQAAAVYFWYAALNNPSAPPLGNPMFNPSCPYTWGSSLFAGLNVTGNDSFPTLEFKIQKDLLDPFALGSFQLSVGVEETDGAGATDQHYIGFGVEYLGPKQFGGSSWDNVLYYPTYGLSQTEGPPVQPANDSLPLTISNLAATSTTPDGASILWLTNKPATTQLIYGSSGVFNLLETVGGFRTSHAITLTGLKAATRYNFKVIAWDSLGGFDSSGVQYFTTRSVPVFISTAQTIDTTAMEGVAYSAQTVVTDADSGEILTYSFLSSPAGMNVGLHTGLITWTPGTPGRYAISLRVRDTNGLSDTLTYALIVSPSGPPPVSQPPILLLPANGAQMTGDGLLGWEPSPDVGLQGNTQYRIQFAKSSAFTDSVRIEGGILTTAIRIRDLKLAPLLPAGFILFWRVKEYDSSGYSTAYSAPNYFVFLGLNDAVEGAGSGKMPVAYSLTAITPNPFRGIARIAYAVPPSRGRLNISLYDIRGNLVRSIIDRTVAPGFREAAFDGQGLGAGLYFVRMEAQGFAQTKPVVVLK